MEYVPAVTATEVPLLTTVTPLPTIRVATVQMMFGYDVAIDVASIVVFGSMVTTTLDADELPRLMANPAKFFAVIVPPMVRLICIAEFVDEIEIRS